MKMNIPLIAVLAAGMPAISSAFTLDAAGFGDSELSLNPVSVLVPGYGELIFEAAVGTTIVVSSAYESDAGIGGPSLSFDQNEAIRISFNGPELLNVDFNSFGLTDGDVFLVQKDPSAPQAFLLALQGVGEGAGLNGNNWNTQAIPEPTNAMLGLIGTAVFASRRRR